MRALILTHGTRGDCQPFVDLANGLNETGHEVVIGAPKGSLRRIDNPQIGVVPFEDLVENLLRDHVISDGIAHNFRGITGRRGKIRFARNLRAIKLNMVRDMFAASELGADIVVYHARLPGHYVADSLGVPGAPTCLAPFQVPNKSIPYPKVQVDLPKFLNRASYLPDRLISRLQSRAEYSVALQKDDDVERKPRRQIGSHKGKPGDILIHAFSEKILPNGTRYPPWVNTTGFWSPKTQSKWQPSEELASFLSGGNPPVYIGFGSMVGDPYRAHEIVVEATRKANVRAIISTGWGGISSGDNSAQIFYLNEASFKWLFPRVSAIIHHGGCGTVSMALNAGKPQVICPFIDDQHFFARQMHSLRVAPQPLPQRKLDASALAHRIRQVLDDERFASRAEEVSQQIRAEDGIGNTISLLEQLVAR